MLKIISSVILVAMLAGCLPIGIRGSSLPNYADAQPREVPALRQLPALSERAPGAS